MRLAGEPVVDEAIESTEGASMGMGMGRSRRRCVVMDQVELVRKQWIIEEAEEPLTTTQPHRRQEEEEQQQQQHLLLGHGKPAPTATHVTLNWELGQLNQSSPQLLSLLGSVICYPNCWMIGGHRKQRNR